MISDEAVEAGAKAIYEGFHTSYKWEDAPDFDGGFRSISLKQARAALEAALPYLANTDEGRSGMSNDAGLDLVSWSVEVAALEGQLEQAKAEHQKAYKAHYGKEEEPL